MERPTRDYMIPTSSVELAMEEDLKALTMDVIALAQSLTNYVYEMGEHDEDAYDSIGEIFEEDVDYTARGEDCHYISMLENEIANYYNPPPLENQQGRQDDEEQEEATLAHLISQMMAIQAQQGEDIQFLISELQQAREARKLLETQLAQQVASSSQNPRMFPSEPDVSTDDVNAITSKSVKIFEEPDGEKRVSTEMVEEVEQPEPEKKEENVGKEVATHQHVQTLEAHDLSIPLEEIYLDYKTRKALEHLTDDCTLKEFLRCIAQAYRDHDDTLCAEDERMPEPMKELLDEGHGNNSSYNNVLLDEHMEFEDVEASKDQGHEDFVEISVDQFIEEPFFKVDTSSKEYFGDLAPKTIIEQLKESTLIKSKSDFEDPFLQPLPQDKFQSFLPFMSCTLDESFNNPFHLKEINYNKGLIAQREVPRRLGGREYKWDFKLDKLQSMRCTA